jgi:hypothetical protein
MSKKFLCYFKYVGLYGIHKVAEDEVDQTSRGEEQY